MKSVFILTSFIFVLSLIITFNSGCSGSGTSATDVVPSQKSGVFALSLTLPASAGGTVSEVPTASVNSPVAKMIIKIGVSPALYIKEMPVIGTSGKILLDDIPSGLKKPVIVEAYNSAGSLVYKTRFTADFIAGQTTTSTAALTEVLDFAQYFPLDIGNTWYETDCIRTVTRQTIFNGQPAIEIKETSYYGKILGYEYFNITSDSILRLGEVDYRNYSGTPEIRAEISSPATVIPRFVQPGDTLNLSITTIEKPWDSSIVSGIQVPSSSTGENSLPGPSKTAEVSAKADSTYKETFIMNILSRQSYSLSNGLTFPDTIKFSMVHSGGAENETEVIVAAKSVGFIHMQETSSTSGTETMILNGYTVQGASKGDTSGTPPANSDLSAPYIPNPAITSTRTDTNTVTITWNHAFDHYAPYTDLLYRVYVSSSANLNNISDAESYGTAVNSWTKNIISHTFTNMSDSVTHYINVFVKDPAGNTSNYAMTTVSPQGAQTDSTPPYLSDGSVHISTTTSNSVVVYWSGATDDTTAAQSLMYKLFFAGNNAYMSDVNNIESYPSFGDWQANRLSAEVTGLLPETTYYFNVLVKDEAGNKNIYGYQSATTQAAGDTTPPTITSNTLSVSSTNNSQTTLSWNAATDNVTAQSALQYKIFYSTASTYISDLANIEANTTSPADWQPAIGTSTVSGLSPETTYYVNVLVKDAAGNKSIYAYQTFTTSAAADTTAPTISNSAITSSAHSSSTYTIAWTAAADNITTSSSLLYKVFYSTSITNVDNISTIESAATAFGDWGSALSTQVTGLSPETVYYFNVLVKDEAGNKTIYQYFTGTTATAPAAGEYWVNAGAASTGDGSSSAPFKTFEEAVTAIGAANGTIKLVTGIYTISSPVTLSGSTTIQGDFTNAGDTSPVSSNVTQLDFSSLTSGSTGIVASSELGLYDLAILGNPNVNGVKCTNQLLAARCDFANFSNALAIEGTAALPNSSQIDLDYVNFTAAATGLSITYNTSSTVTLDNMYFSGCMIGINMDNASSPAVNEIQMYGDTASSTNTGIILSTCNNAQLTTTQIQAYSTGVSISSSSSVKVSDVHVNSSNAASTTPSAFSFSSCTGLLAYRLSAVGGGSGSTGAYIASSTGTLSNFIAAPTFTPGTDNASSKGLQVSSCSSSLVLVNNLFFACDQGILLDSSTPIIKSTVFDSCANYSIREGDSASDYVTVEYSFFRHSPYYDSTYGALSSQSSFETAIGSTAATGNIFYASPDEPANAIMTAPESGNFQPPTTSPLIDAGPTTGFADANLPIGGTTRNDIGPAGGPYNTTDLSTYMNLAY